MYARRPYIPGGRHSPYPRERMDSGSIQDRAESTLTSQSLSCSSGHDTLSSPDLLCTGSPQRLPRKPTLSLQRPWGGEGYERGGESSADLFLDHVAVTSNQSAEVGVHPEDPAGSPQKPSGAFRPRVSLCWRASFHLLSPDPETGSNEFWAWWRGPSRCLLQSRLSPIENL